MARLKLLVSINKLVESFTMIYRNLLTKANFLFDKLLEIIYLQATIQFFGYHFKHNLNMCDLTIECFLFVIKSTNVTLYEIEFFYIFKTILKILQIRHYDLNLGRM